MFLALQSLYFLRSHLMSVSKVEQVRKFLVLPLSFSSLKTVSFCLRLLLSAAALFLSRNRKFDSI